MDLEAYDAIAECGGIPKPAPREKKAKQLKKRAPLKSNYKPIPTELKMAVLEQKGGRCFAGHCPVCGGAPVGVGDSFHHFPHRSQGGKDCLEHLWACRWECHREIHDAPWMEKEMFKEIEGYGIPVVWKVVLKC